MADESLELKKFDMHKIKNDSVCCFIAPRNSGKSILIKDLLYHHQDIPAGLVISKTDKLCHYYDKFIPPILIHDRYKPELLDKLFERQQKGIEEKWKNPYCFLIFDDTLSEANSWKKDERVNEIFYNGRHYKILFLLTMQAPMGIPPGLRCNIDFTFILRNTNSKSRKDLYENYAGMFPTKEIFEKVLDSCTEDYNCLVIDNTTKSNKLEDQVFYYKAKVWNDDSFRMCNETFWTMKKKENGSKSSDVKNSYVKRDKSKFTVIRK